MNMFSQMMGALVDKEQSAKDTIQDALENIAIELNCSHKDYFVMIKPINEEFEMKFYIYKLDEKGIPKQVREISLKEILNPE